MHINSDNNPRMSIVKAVRKSAGLPLYFQALCEKDRQGICHSYIDGGVLDNYPIHSLCKFLKHEQVIGVKLLNTKEIKPNISIDKHPVSDVAKFIEILIEGLRKQALTFHVKSNDWERTIKVDILSYTATNFGISGRDMMRLIKQGEYAADKFLIEYLS